MILKQEKNKIIIKIQNYDENEIKLKLKELVEKGLKEATENNQLILDLGDLGLNEYEFKKIIETFNLMSIEIDMIRSTNPITKMISVNYGLPVEASSIINTQNKLEPRAIPIGSPSKITPKDNNLTKNSVNTLASSVTSETNSKQDIYIYKKNVRSGSILESDKTIILIGNVNPGAEVRSSKNIIVLGKLMGTAHAGYTNNPNAVIFCLKLKNPLIKIANMVAEFNEEEIKKQIKSKEISNILFYTDDNYIKMEIIKEQKE
ncbi:MAG: septum site-determining protein MinC [bacterium]